MNWQDRWTVPLAAMALAGFLIYYHALDGFNISAGPLFTPNPVATPFAVFVHPKLRDPFMLANEWDALLVSRDKMIRDRFSAAEAAREDAEEKRLEAEDEEYFRATGKHRRLRNKLALPTSGTTSTPRHIAVPPPPPPPPAFKIAGVLIGGGQRTAVLNDRVVTVGDTVQGFKVTLLDGKTLELVGTIEPWKGKRLTVPVATPPPGVRFVKARSMLQSAGQRGVIVIPPMFGDSEKSTPPTTGATEPVQPEDQR